MPDKQILLRDSLQHITRLKTLEDSLRLSKQSAISYWFDQMLSPELSFQFFESLLLIFLGGLFAYLLYHRSERIKSIDRLQARALLYAALALLCLASKGIFFLISSFALSGILPASSYGQLYWLGWQISLLWFVYCSFMFAIGFTRSRKSYDLFFATSLALLFLVITAFYNEWFWKWLLYKMKLAEIDPARIDILVVTLAPPLPFKTEVLIPQLSPFASFSLGAHFTLWFMLFTYAAYVIFRRGRTYQDSSARNAVLILSLSFLILALFGIFGLLKFRQDFSLVASKSYLIALICLVIFFFGVRNTYRHGRYRRA
jgi:hypothetical protein